ncbi:MAG: hypothetical protein V8R16_07370 [Bacilli bacterium]
MAKINIKTTEEVIPMIYAYTTPGIIYHDGWTKIGYTERDVDLRIKEQTQTAHIIPHKEWQDLAIFSDGKTRFTDKEFHTYLEKNNIKRMDLNLMQKGVQNGFTYLEMNHMHYLVNLKGIWVFYKHLVLFLMF